MFQCKYVTHVTDVTFVTLEWKAPALCLLIALENNASNEQGAVGFFKIKNTFYE